MLHQFGGDILHAGGREIGVLVIHGITVSPSYMAGVIDPLRQAGFTVYAPRLAGHGMESQNELKNHGYADWQKTVDDAVTVLRDMGCKKIFAVGHSLGAVLALYLAEHDQLDGVVSMAEPYYIFGYWRAKLFSTFMKNKYVQMNFGKIPEGAFRYEKMCGKSTADLLEAMMDVNSHLDQVKCPALVINCRNDQTVLPSSAKHVYHSIETKQKDLIHIEAPHQCTYKKEHCGQYMPQIISFIQNNS